MRKKVSTLAFIIILSSILMPITLCYSGKSVTHVVYPTGNLELDGDNIQNAIYSASPGDTILLKATNIEGVSTPFVLGKQTDSDFLIYTASGSLNIREFTAYNKAPLIDRDISKDQSIDINKEGLTIKGETGKSKERLPNGKKFRTPKTEITVPDDLKSYLTGNWLRPVYGYGGIIVINAKYVTIKNIRIDGLATPLTAFSPGFNINQCIFDKSGPFMDLAPDLELTYPDYPNLNNPIKSIFKDNIFIDITTGIHVIGGEITVKNNHFGFKDGDIYPAVNILSWKDLSMGFINWDHSINNVVKGNYIDADYSSDGIWVTCGWGGTSSDNIVERNTIVNALWGIQTWDSQNINIIENNIESCLFGIEVYLSSEVIVRKNELTGCENGVLVESSNDIDIVKNEIKDSSYYGIALTDGSSNCLIEKNEVEDSGEYDLFWDSTGFNNIWVDNEYDTKNWI